MRTWSGQAVAANDGRSQWCVTHCLLLHIVPLETNPRLGAGKSTVREIIGSNAFWSSVGQEAVVIEADAIKNQDVVYQELKDNPVFADDDTLSAFVHEYSTKRANSMLVAAVNAQKDIIFDGAHAHAPCESARGDTMWKSSHSHVCDSIWRMLCMCSYSN